MKHETIEYLVGLWESLEQEQEYVKFSRKWWKNPGVAKKKRSRMSIRTWQTAPDWIRILRIYWQAGSWVRYLAQTGTLLWADDIMRNDIQIARWKLGDYIPLLEGNSKDFVERLQHFLAEFANALDEVTPL